MAKICLMLGLQGSGKTTRAKELCGTIDAVRISKDDIRTMLHDGAYSPENEQLVKSVWEGAIAAALAVGQDVIIDDAGNLNPATQQKIADRFGAEAEITFDRHCLGVSIEECIKRDLRRLNSVGEAVIRQYADRYLPKPVRTIDPNKPEAIVVDVDGVLAVMGDRSPFDYRAADVDTVNPLVASFLTSVPDHQTIILLTGREEHSEDMLIQWLNRNFVTFDSEMVYMRPDGDRAPSDVFKSKALDKIEERFNVMLLVDDDPKVIGMAQSRQIPTWHVQGGDRHG